jgi:hypothetical protein
MSIVAFVARDAGTWRGTVLLACHVATGAGCNLVGTVESEIRESVVESRFVKRDDASAPALVIRVTRLAFRRLDLGPLPVESALISDVGAYVLVTVEAKTPLARLREWLVATFALLFKLGMWLDYFSGKYELLK